MISIIAAMDERRGIGKNNDLLFRISEDHKRLRELTNGHPIIMGRKTYESIGRVLPQRTNIIITRDPQYRVEGAIICHSLEEAIAEAKTNPGMDEIFIFGGGQIFAEALQRDLVDKLYLTHVKGDLAADTFFPDYSQFQKVVYQEEREAEGYKYKFLELEK